MSRRIDDRIAELLFELREVLRLDLLANHGLKETLESPELHHRFMLIKRVNRELKASGLTVIGGKVIQREA
jgi:hypothetical protein